MPDDQSLTMDNGGDGLTYLEEMRLAKIVRKTMPGHGRRSLLHRSASSRTLIVQDRRRSSGTMGHPPQRRQSGGSRGSDLQRLSNSFALKSMMQFLPENFDLNEDEDEDDDEDDVAKDEDDPEEADAGRKSRASALSNAKAWKSMAHHIRFANTDDESLIGDMDMDMEDISDGHDHGERPFYTKPFFDLFFVAAAYNLGNLLISALNKEQWMRGMVYIFGIFGGIYNTFLRCMMYDSQFSVHDHAHRLLEVVRIFLVSVVVLHIKSIDLLMDPRSAETFTLTMAMFLETLVHVILNLELFWFGEGDTSAIKNQTQRELFTNLLPLSAIYLAATIVSGIRYFSDATDTVYPGGTAEDPNETKYGYDKAHRGLGSEYAGAVASDPDWRVADVPLVLCFVASVVSIGIQGISSLKLSPNVPDIRSKIVPMNSDFFIHRFGEFTMLFFGEAVMGLLIVETTESSSYYMVAMIGVLNVIVLQAFKYESEPHGHGEEHCLWKGLRSFFAYSLLTQVLCLGLIAFAVSFKVGLGILLSEHKSESYDDGGYGYTSSYSNNTASYEDDTYDIDLHAVRALRGLAGAAPTISPRAFQILYCSSLTVVLICIELMAYSHKGLGKTYSFISQRTTRARIQWKRVFGTLFKIGLVGIVTTLYLWVERPGVMVCIGFAISNLFVFAKVVEHITETRSEDWLRKAPSKSNVSGALISREGDETRAMSTRMTKALIRMLDLIVNPPKAQRAYLYHPRRGQRSNGQPYCTIIQRESYSTSTTLPHPNVRITGRPNALQQGDDATTGKHDIYQAICTLFTESEGARLLPLLLDIFNVHAIGGLGIFQEDAAAVNRLRVIHGLRQYPGTITQPSVNFSHSFGYINDVEGQECELVQVDAALLSKAAASRVYLLAHHEATISQHPDREYVPAIPEGTAHTEMLQADKVCFLPFEIVPLVLCRGLTPKQAFQILHPHILQQELADVCKPLLDTLRAVGTQPTTLLGTIPLLEPGPYLLGLPAPADPTLAAAFAALTDYQLRLSENLDQRRQESSKLHTVREVWGPLYTERLLLLCGKTNKADLPPIYTAWAKKSKHEKTHMIPKAPLITTAVLKQFQDCNFYGTNPFDVGDGILPLAFTPPGGSAATLKREHEEQAANVAAYDLHPRQLPLSKRLPGTAKDQGLHSLGLD
eukprot:jgi/Psemu1/33950/gm1.33950_g